MLIRPDEQQSDPIRTKRRFRIRPFRLAAFVLVFAMLGASLWLADAALSRVTSYRGSNPIVLKVRKHLEYVLDYPVAVGEQTFTRNYQDPDASFPSFVIELPNAKIRELNDALPENIEVRQPHHPEVKAIVTALGFGDVSPVRTPIQLRTRGDSANHWYFKKKSWRLRFTDGGTFKGMRKVNLVNPKSPSLLNDYIAHRLAKRIGALAPEMEVVSLFINKDFHGVLLLIEQPDEYFLQREGIPEGNVYADNGRWPGLLYEDVQAWKKLTAYDGRPENDYQDLDALLSLIQHADDAFFTDHIEEILDVEATLRWHAISDFFQSSHQGPHHNGRWYCDPTDGRFRPIMWDLQAFFPYDFPQGADHPIVKRLFEFPQYVARYDRIRAGFVTDPAVEEELVDHLDEMIARIRPQVHVDKNKAYMLAAGERARFSNRRFEEAAARLRARIVTRFADWRRALEVEPLVLLTARPVEDAICLELQMPGQCVLDVQGFQLTHESLEAPNWDVYRDSNGDGEWDTNDMFFGSAATADAITTVAGSTTLRTGPDAADRHDLRTERFFLVSPHNSMPSDVKLNAWRRVGSHARAAISSFKAVSEHRWQQTSEHRPLTNHWGPGIVHVENTVTLRHDETLVIVPGTEVRLAPRASILARGRVIAVGTEDEPISFIGNESEPWGVFALLGPGGSGSRFAFCTFEAGSEARLDGVTFTGMLAIHHARADVISCTFRGANGDDALNCKYWQGTIESCTFEDNGFDSIDLDFSGGLVRNTTILRSGNDGIDLGTCTSRLENLVVADCGDKGMSFGERSTPMILNCEIRGNRVGLASKDLSRVELVQCSVTENNVGMALYQKKRAYGGGFVHVTKCTVIGNGMPFGVDDSSQVHVEHSSVDDCTGNKRVSLGEGVEIVE